MGGVDHFDQFLSTYSISWKSRRWWVKIFYYLVDSAIVNSYILYKQSCAKQKEKPMSHLKFRSSLADEMIANYNGRKRRGPAIAIDRKIKKPRGRTISVENTIRNTDVGAHLPIRGTSRRCAYCSTKEKSKRSQMICRRYEVGLYLECFAPFHENYFFLLQYLYLSLNFICLIRKYVFLIILVLFQRETQKWSIKCMCHFTIVKGTKRSLVD